MSQISSPKDSIISEETRQKLDSLIYGFNKNNINLQTPLSKSQIENYLNKRTTSKNQFNPILLNKLLEQLNLNENNKTITLEYFVKYFIQFEYDLNSQINNFTDKYNNSKEEYNKINNECEKHKNEKINEEGFCDSAKITIIIENIDLKNKIEGIKNLFIKIIYNNEIREIEFDIEKKNEINKIFEL